MTALWTETETKRLDRIRIMRGLAPAPAPVRLHPRKYSRRYKKVDISSRPTPKLWRPVIADICRRHDTTMKDVLSHAKFDYIVRARQEMWWQIQLMFGASLSDIGRRTGGFHHTTVMYGIRKFRGLIK